MLSAKGQKGLGQFHRYPALKMTGYVIALLRVDVCSQREAWHGSRQLLFPSELPVFGALRQKPGVFPRRVIRVTKAAVRLLAQAAAEIIAEFIAKKLNRPSVAYDVREEKGDLGDVGFLVKGIRPPENRGFV